MATRRVTIVGGGLAGLTLGIGLRQRGVPVTIWEAGGYPRHRVCGEFISGRGLDILEALGLREQFLRSGARPATTAVFFTGQKAFPLRRLPSPALCFSRLKMDELLARRFAALGGELKTAARWESNDFGEGVVCAQGRRLVPADGDWRWFGLKMHASNVALTADLEMHVLEDGYVGLCRLADGRVNVCGLFRRPPPGQHQQRGGGRGNARDGRERLRGPAGSWLRERLANAAFDGDSFCAVAGLCLRPQRARVAAHCSLGDALTMIPPVTGNGMSLAFESAQMAVEPLAAYSRDAASWARARQIIARDCDRAFGPRLAWAGWLHRLLFSPLPRTRPGRVLLGSEWLWRMLFARTRA
jgi:2-polyprenyl-6-methoxyphenol hydroxylase-like FAD-dependent oxidoreductase